METTPVKTSKRELAIQLLSGLCGLAALIGTLPVDSKDIPLPPEWRPYIISIGFAGLTIDRWAKYVIAVLKNIRLDQVGLFLLCSMMAFMTSCGIQFTEDGCVLGKYSRGGSTYAAGPCVGLNQEINRYRVQWSNQDGQKLRATYWTKEKRPVLVEYFTGTIWLQWSSKAGVVIGPLPPEVEKALDGKPEAIPAPTPNLPKVEPDPLG